MIIEIARLMFALVILCFHRQIADFILEQERRLAALLIQHGFHVPQFPSRELAHDLYFSIGAIVSAACLFRLWMALHVR